jgi:hypothetical protein
MTATVDETGNSIDLTGHFDHYRDGTLMFTADDMHSTGVRMVPAATNATPTS